MPCILNCWLILWLPEERGRKGEGWCLYGRYGTVQYDACVLSAGEKLNVLFLLSLLLPAVLCYAVLVLQRASERGKKGGRRNVPYALPRMGVPALVLL